MPLDFDGGPDLLLFGDRLGVSSRVLYKTHPVIPEVNSVWMLCFLKVQMPNSSGGVTADWMSRRPGIDFSKTGVAKGGVVK